MSGASKRGSGAPASRFTIKPSNVEFFEDAEAGQSFECGTFVFNEAEIIDFARDFDPQSIHTDPEIAKSSFAGALTASGIHTYAASMSMFSRAVTRLKLVAGVKMREIEMLAPVLAEVPLTVFGTWVEKRESKSKPDIGIVTWEAETRSQEGKPVLRCGATIMVKRRPPSM